MPFVIAGLALIGALIYGAVRLYAVVAAAYGGIAGGAAVLACAALLAACVVRAVRRYRAVHGVNVKGERILSLDGAWGTLRIDAEQKRGVLDVGGQRARFIFADIAEAAPRENGGQWHLALRLAHNAQADWQIPMENRKTAMRWARIFELAAIQKL